MADQRRVLLLPARPVEVMTGEPIIDKVVAELHRQEQLLGDGACEILAKAIYNAREFLPGPEESYLQDMITRFEVACFIAREAAGIRPRTIEELLGRKP